MQLFEPFHQLNFFINQCFLCGNRSGSKMGKLPVFPEWFMKKYNLYGKAFKMLNETIKVYEELQISCCNNCKTQFIEPLEEYIEEGFKGRYLTIKNLDPWKIFLWVSKIMYGIIYLEILIALDDHAQEQRANRENKAGMESISEGATFEPLGISPSLLNKFSNVHLFLQSLRFPMELEDFSPYSYWLFPLNEDENNVFEYRDDMSTLIFSLTAQDFGFILCLQDNSSNESYHKRLYLRVMEKYKTLSFKQFQEFRARVFYSAYLFNPIPTYLLIPPTSGHPQYTITAQPLAGGKSNLFKPWNNKTYAQVLEAFWKPWGITKNEILENEASPLSFL